MCSLVCPNDAIMPEYNPRISFLFHKTGEDSLTEGRQEKRSPDITWTGSIHEDINAHRPALDAGRHEFRIRTYLGRILPADELPISCQRLALEL